MEGYMTIIVAAVAFVVSATMGKLMIPFLRRLKFGQTINDIGPTWHKSKQGTPTMGGLLFIIGITAAVLVGYLTLIISSNRNGMTDPAVSLQNRRMLAGLIMALAFAFIGFTDDYIKVVKKRNLGLTAKQKIVMQFLVAVVYLVTLKLVGGLSTVLIVPPFGEIELGIFYYPLAMIIIIGFVNAVNLTDGIDGLAGSVTFVYAVVFIVISAIVGFDRNGMLAAALAGGCLGFLIWNFYPAKVFMGDTGSMFLGGMVVALAFGVDMPIIILLAGVIYLVEAFSVMIQVFFYKLTGKRLFKMSPIHHHFEMSGYSETKIVVLFSAVALIGGGLTALFVYLL
ncbi:MAG: phospho-N-acetylmuramoyl-pentapeptide-transferase [Oscillospiraceae bacterium]|nr:phospho-N-acetylmuramoyl-pentapeptide-transferase [Oscillospiraceae bacterium]MBQ9938067.1 phospho-N-acetylmuramoyl-pentapeptide-transferase [Oscillospiraceae bacterium]